MPAQIEHSPELLTHLRETYPDLTEEEIAEHAEQITVDQAELMDEDDTPEAPEGWAEDPPPPSSQTEPDPPPTAGAVDQVDESEDAQQFMDGRQAQWNNCIAGYKTMHPDELTANDKNWREHPDLQNEAMLSLFSKIGWLQNVIWNKTTGKLLDGHLRLNLAIAHGQTEIPVTIVELTEDEENLALITYDTISAMASANSDKLQALLDSIDDDSIDSSIRDTIDVAVGMAGLYEDGVDEAVEQAAATVDDTNPTEYWPDVRIPKVDPSVKHRFDLLLQAATGETNAERFEYLTDILDQDSELSTKADVLEAEAEEE